MNSDTYVFNSVSAFSPAEIVNELKYLPGCTTTHSDVNIVLMAGKSDLRKRQNYSILEYYVFPLHTDVSLYSKSPNERTLLAIFQCIDVSSHKIKRLVLKVLKIFSFQNRHAESIAFLFTEIAS
jgi:hypothetical protein